MLENKKNIYYRIFSFRSFHCTAFFWLPVWYLQSFLTVIWPLNRVTRQVPRGNCLPFWSHLRSSPNIRRVCVASLYLLCLFTLVIVCFCLFLIISDIYFTSVNTGMKRRFKMKIQQNMWPMVSNLSANFYKKNMLHSLNTI